MTSRRPPCPSVLRSVKVRQPARAAPSSTSAISGCSSSTDRGNAGMRSISTIAAVSSPPSMMPVASCRSSGRPM